MAIESLVGTAVVNRRDWDNSRPSTYIGRGSPWGNPFRIGEHGTRDKVCNRFEREVLPTLDVEPLRGRVLVCFCKPLRCHGDAIIQKLKNTSPR